MKQITFLLVAVAALAGVVAMTVPASLHADDSRSDLRNKHSPRIPRLEVDLRGSRRGQPQQLRSGVR